MKKTIILSALLLLFGIAVMAGNDPVKNNSREIAILPFTKLSVSANVTVILYESPSITSVVVKGKENYARKIAVLQKGSKLLITSKTNDDLKEKVTVYIPVYKLRSLEVINDPVIKSQTILDCPDLEVEADGLCEIHLIVNGNVNIKDGANYTSIRRIKPEHAAMRLSMPVFY